MRFAVAALAALPAAHYNTSQLCLIKLLWKKYKVTTSPQLFYSVPLRMSFQQKNIHRGHPLPPSRVSELIEHRL
jgi:hypothetical protein